MSEQTKKQNERRQRDIELAIKAKAGDTSARETLIVENMELVKKLLWRYTGKGVPDDVLFQEGCYGLIIAVDKYDPKREVALSTYASHYIEKYIKIALRENLPYPIQLKEKAYKALITYKQEKAKLTEELGRCPSVQEIAGYLGITYKNAFILSNIDALSYSFQELEEKGYSTPSNSGRSAEDEVISRLNEMDINDSSLTPLEKEIIYLHFGFGDEDPWTFKEIGKAIGMTDVSVCEHCKKAIDKLRKEYNAHSIHTP